MWTILLLAKKFLSAIPRWLWLMIFGALVVIGFIFYGHIRYEQGKKDLQDQQSLQVRYITKERKVVTTKVVNHYVDRIKYIKVKGKTIVEKVPVYVTKKDDSSCTINNGFVRLWNYSNRMQVPPAASSVDESPSDVVLSDVAAQHGKEVQACYETREQLINLQDWVKEQAALH